MLSADVFQSHARVIKHEWNERCKIQVSCAQRKPTQEDGASV